MKSRTKSNYYVQFTEEMKRTHTILAPNMLPLHFRFLLQVLNDYGYKTELLETKGPEIIETGLKYVHNDACYPALLVIGQFINALHSGKYDPHKVALIYFQTGGGCRASNYISLLRKALARAGYEYVPVISFSLAGLETHPGFKLSYRMLKNMAFGIMYADLIMSLVYQCRPYEKQRGDCDALALQLTNELAADLHQNGAHFSRFKQKALDIQRKFDEIPRSDVKRTPVGIVGEIYVKFSPLGNNNLVEFLENEGCECYVPGLLDFVMFYVYHHIAEKGMFGLQRIKLALYKLAYKLLLRIQHSEIRVINEYGRFRAPAAFEHTVERVQRFIGLGCKMGEGWLLPAEMLELYDSGVRGIVCTQPFGCLPNHICGKGMIKPLKDAYPDMNIVAVDYDPGATRVNQENRIKLMLANCRD